MCERVRERKEKEASLESHHSAGFFLSRRDRRTPLLKQRTAKGAEEERRRVRISHGRKREKER